MRRISSNIQFKYLNVAEKLLRKITFNYMVTSDTYIIAKIITEFLYRIN